MSVFYWYDSFGQTFIDKLDSLKLYTKRMKVYNKTIESITSGGYKQHVGLGFNSLLYRGALNAQKMRECKDGITRVETTY